MKIFIPYSINDEVILGIYSSKYKSFKRVFESWLDNNGIDESTLKDYDDLYVGDENIGDSSDAYGVYRTVLDPLDDIELDMDSTETKLSVILPKTFEDLKSYLKKEES
jgi:hypothetical protein